jgi:hypothetical protein
MYRSTNIRVPKKLTKGWTLAPRLWAAVAVAMAFGVTVSTMRSPRSGAPISSAYRCSDQTKSKPRFLTTSEASGRTESAPPVIEERTGGGFSLDGSLNSHTSASAEPEFPNDRDLRKSNTEAEDKGLATTCRSLGAARAEDNVEFRPSELKGLL